MVEQYQAAGFIVFSGLIAAAFQRPLGSAARSLRLVATLPSHPRVLRIRPSAVKAIVAGLAAAVLFLGRMELKVSSQFTVLASRNADVHAMVDGLVEHVYVEEGDHVGAGDVLVRLADRDYRAELGNRGRDCRTTGHAQDAGAGPRREEIEAARRELLTATTRQEHTEKRFDEAGRIRSTRLSKSDASVKAAEERLQFRRAELRRLTELAGKGLVAQKQLEESQHEVVLADKELEAARADFQIVTADDLGEPRQELAVTETQVDEVGGKLKLLLAGSRPEALEAIEAAIARLEAQRRFLSEQLALTAIVSPTAGVVGTPSPPRTGEPPSRAVATSRLKDELARTCTEAT